MIKYGLINEVDASVLESAIDFIQKDFPDEVINYAEVGLYHGATTRGIKEYLDSKNAKYVLTGIDNFKDKEELVFYPKEATLIVGSSIEVYNQLPDNSQHLILIDGNHSFPYVIADFFCYSGKVKEGGYIAFHDAAPHAQNKSYQRMGSEHDMDMYISVRKALKAIGLLIADSLDEMWQDKFGRMYQYATGDGNKCWELIFDKCASQDIDEGGGTLLFKKLY